MTIDIYSLVAILGAVKPNERELHMRVSREEMARSHRKIVDSASRLLRERGVEGAGVAEVMSDAGLTHGGFYRHFETKEAMLLEALKDAFADFAGPLESASAGPVPARALAHFRARYLSPGHVANPGVGCPVAALAGEAGRGSDHLKSVFGDGVKRIIAAMALGLKGTAQERSTAATREFAMMVGAVAIARASDRKTGRAVLAACQPAIVDLPAGSLWAEP